MNNRQSGYESVNVFDAEYFCSKCQIKTWHKVQVTTPSPTRKVKTCKVCETQTMA